MYAIAVPSFKSTQKCNGANNQHNNFFRCFDLGFLIFGFWPRILIPVHH